MFKDCAMIRFKKVKVVIVIQGNIAPLIEVNNRAVTYVRLIILYVVTDKFLK